MKPVLMAAMAVAAVAITITVTAVVSFDVPDMFMKNTGVTGRIDMTDNNIGCGANTHEFDIPPDWQYRPSGVLDDAEFDALIAQATDNSIYDNRYDEYSEPQSLDEGGFTTSIRLHVAKSDLTQLEYENMFSDIMSAFEAHYGIDINLLDSRQDVLGGSPAITTEYVIVNLADPEIPAVKFIETTTIIPTCAALYSLSYGSEIDDYDEHLHNFERAVQTFRFT